jgi:hypothetical protein
MVDVICTLFEGHYHAGAAALLNSLHRNGFRGIALCGFRGEAPPWASQIGAWAPIDVRLVQMDPPTHFTTYKPAVMKRAFADFGAEQVHYVDPDIVVEAPWSMLHRWAADGVALVRDMNHDVPERDPRRLLWRDHLAERGQTTSRLLSSYFNGGYVGLPRFAQGLLDAWQAVIDGGEESFGRPIGLGVGPPWALFHLGDQDALNMALELVDIKINAASEAAMGFAEGGELLLPHATGTPKPWRAHPLLEAADGRPPSPAALAYLRHSQKPVRAIAMFRWSYLRTTMALATAIGKVYRRPPHMPPYA